MNPMLSGVIKDLLEPVSKMIDELHVSVEEKAQLKNQIYAAAIQMAETALAYERDNLVTRAKIIRDEANGKSWPQRNWRPVTMLSFVSMMIYNWTIVPTLGMEPVVYPDWVGEAFKIGLGGYVVGRSAEKVVSTVTLNRDLLKTPGEEERLAKLATKQVQARLKSYQKMLKQAKSEEERLRILDMMSDEASA